MSQNDGKVRNNIYFSTQNIEWTDAKSNSRGEMKVVSIGGQMGRCVGPNKY